MHSPQTSPARQGEWLPTSRWRDLTRFLSAAKGDLANMTAPPTFLADCSVVENPRCWAETPRIFVAPALEADPQKRSLLVLRMFLAGLRNQYYIGGAPGVSIKKPLNAFLGEIYLSTWSDPEVKATTKLVSEQVSHHPPITAVHIASEEHGIRADGYARVEMTFSGTLNVRQIGHTTMHIDDFDEDYLLPLPDVQIRGFLSACLYPEIRGTYKIISSSGYVSEIIFSGSRILRGKSNSFTASVYHQHDPTHKPAYTLAGVWSEGWVVKDAVTGSVLEKYDVDREHQEAYAVQVMQDIDQQDPWESRRAWNDVLRGIREGDWIATSNAKWRIEEAQRELRKVEKSQGSRWQPLFFRSSMTGRVHDIFHRLTNGENWKLADEETLGVWDLKEEALKSLEKPFRGNLSPSGET